MSTTGRVVSVNLAHVIETPGQRHPGRVDVKPALTGIDKRPTDGPVAVGRLGLAGDAILDTVNHGGELQAVYAYAVEDQDWWAAEIGRPIAPGSFGENLTVTGLPVNDAHPGERWRIGDTVVLEVTFPRIPCSTFAAFIDQPHWVKRFASAGRPGAYLRVVQPGEVTAGDTVEVTPGRAEEPTIRDAFAAYYRR